MKKTLAAFALAMLSTQALAFDYFRSMDEDSARKRQLADYQRLEHDSNYQKMQQNSRLMQLEHNASADTSKITNGAYASLKPSNTGRVGNVRTI
jgi:hypothetical protein